MSKPGYVARDNEIVYPPPYLQSDATITAWVLPSPLEEQSAILAAQLNFPTGEKKYVYEPVIPYVLLVLADIKRVTSLDDVAKDYGYIPEVDICIWMVCQANTLDEHGAPQLDHLAVFVPYIWVTNADTMATGREVYGYPKAMGWAQLPQGPDDPGPLWASGLVLKELSPTSIVSQQRLLELHRVPVQTKTSATRATRVSPVRPDSSPSLSPVQQQVDLLRRLTDALDDDIPESSWTSWLAYFAGWAVAYWPLPMPMVFLKQFRDASEQGAACYQAIIEANATVRALSTLDALPEDWELTLFSYASVDMPRHLGLAAKQRAAHGFQTTVSFSMDLGREVWSAKETE